MPTNHSRHYREVTAATSADESPVILLEIVHPDLAEPIRVVNDAQDFPYGFDYHWAPGNAVAINAIAVPADDEDGNPGYTGKYYRCITAGVTGAIEPAWPNVVGATVADGTAVWECAGNQFKAIYFRCRKPDDSEGQLPRAELSVDNVGKELVAWIETSGGGKGATCRMMEALRSAPAVIEWDITLDLTDIKISPVEVLGYLGFEDLLNRVAVPFTYRPETAPGIF